MESSPYSSLWILSSDPLNNSGFRKSNAIFFISVNCIATYSTAGGGILGIIFNPTIASSSSSSLSSVFIPTVAICYWVCSSNSQWINKLQRNFNRGTEPKDLQYKTKLLPERDKKIVCFGDLKKNTMVKKKKDERSGPVSIEHKQNHICQWSSVAQSCLTLQLHGLQDTRLPYPSPTPEACSNSCPLSQWWIKSYIWTTLNCKDAVNRIL